MSAASGATRSELGWTTLSSLVLAVAAALAAGASTLPSGTSAHVYVALSGGAAATAVPLAIGLRSLRRWAGRGTVVVRVVLFGGWLAVGPLALLGALMKAHTHHRPLAGATYAVVGLVVALGALAVASRLTVLTRSDARTVARMAVIVVALLAGAVNLLAFRRPASEPGVARALLDGLLLAGAVVIAARMNPRVRPSATIALLVWAAVVTAGAQALSDPTSAATAAERAPLLLGPLWILV